MSVLAPAPRAVPWSLAAVELLGDALTQFGLAFAGFGLIFVWIFAAHADLAGWHTYAGALETASAAVEDCAPTAFHVGGRRRADSAVVYANRYSFTAPPGATFRGVSYAVGDCAAGRSVTVEWPAGRPQDSRLRGMRSQPLPPFAAIVLVFPAVGAVFLALGLREGLKDVRLLRDGTLAEATVSGRRPTTLTVNHRRVWEVDLSFRTERGAPAAGTAKTDRPEALEGGPVKLLYLPDDPRVVVPLAALPQTAAVDDVGQWRAAPFGRTAAVLVLPTLILGGHAAYLLLRR